MSPRARVDRTVATAALLAGVLVLAACGGDGSEEPKGAGRTTASAAATTSPTGPSDSPTAGSTFGVAPATGLLLETDNAAVNAPEGWTQAEALATFQKGADAPDGESGMDLGELP